jgi:GntR family transcriptional regulator/MocR family aminotransferase
VTRDKLVADRGASRIEEYAFADFLARGELDRHLRRMRARYRKQRDALVHALAEELPEAVITGIAAGLHASVQLPEGSDAEAIREEAGRRRIMLNSMSDYRAETGADSTTLMVGYGSVPEAAIVPGVRELAEAVRAVTSQAGGSR